MKSGIKLFVKYIIKIVLLLACLAGLYLFTALVLSFIKAPQSKEAQCSEKKIIFLSNNGVHLSLVIPVEYLNDSMRIGLQAPSTTHYVSFGWGDREFYLNTPEWSDLTFKTAVTALFLKSTSAMHVTFNHGISSRWKRVGVCPNQIGRLMTFIEQSFVIEDGSGFVPIQCPGYETNDCFFAAHGSFSCFRTCNVWVNQAFKFAGVSTSVWSPFVYGVEYHIAH